MEASSPASPCDRLHRRGDPVTAIPSFEASHAQIIAHALLTLPGAASEATGLDRTLKAKTSKKRTHSRFRQEPCWYRAMPSLRDDRFEELLTAFDGIVNRHDVCFTKFLAIAGAGSAGQEQAGVEPWRGSKGPEDGREHGGIVGCASRACWHGGGQSAGRTALRTRLHRWLDVAAMLTTPPASRIAVWAELLVMDSCVCMVE